MCLKGFLKLLQIVLFVSTTHLAFSFKPSNEKVIPISIDTNQINELYNQAWDIKASFPDSAFKLANNAFKYCNIIDFKKGKAKCLNIMGVIALNKGRFDDALNYHRASLQIGQQIGDKQLVSNSFQNIGNVYKDKGFYEEALLFMLNSLKLKEEIGNRKGMASSYMNIGNVFLAQSKYQLASDYYHKGLILYKESNDKNGIGYCLNNLANIYYKSLQFDKALEYYLNAQLIFEESNNRSSLANLYNNIGSLYLEQGKYLFANKYLQKSLQIFIELDDYNGQALVYFNMGEIARKENKVDEAQRYAEKSLALSQQIGNRTHLQDVFFLLSSTYKAKGNYKKALDYYHLYFSYYDSIYNLQSAEKIAEMQSKYESEKKEKEIALLTKDKELQFIQISKMNQSRLFFVICFLLALVVAMISFYSFYQKKRANYALKIRNQEIDQQKEEIMAQRDEIEKNSEIINQAYLTIQSKNKDITDSIVYANGIQKAFLPTEEWLTDNLNDYFIVFYPKDIISGDFYWAAKNNDIIFMAAVDCTGHGVPGAMMSLIGFNFLNQAVNIEKLTKPAEILNYLNEGVNATLKQSFGEFKYKDGMDISLCAINTSNLILSFSGAYNPIVILRDQEIIEFKGDVHPIGIPFVENSGSYTNQEIELKKNDVVYLFTDGYMDQFGAESRMKFTRLKFKNLLLQIHKLPMLEQKALLQAAFLEWKGSSEQIDDVLIFAKRIC